MLRHLRPDKNSDKLRTIIFARAMEEQTQNELDVVTALPYKKRKWSKKYVCFLL